MIDCRGAALWLLAKFKIIIDWDVMIKSSIGVLLLVSACLASTAYAGECAKTLMGSDCAKQSSGVSSHMRGNAAANAKAAKALKAAQVKAKAKAKAVAMKK